MSPRIGSRDKHPRDFSAGGSAEQHWLDTRAERERIAQEKKQQQETDPTTPPERGPKENDQ